MASEQMMSEAIARAVAEATRIALRQWSRLGQREHKMQQGPS